MGIESFEIRPGITAVTPFDFTHYPWSHSLVAPIAWGAIFALAYRVVRPATPRTTLAVLALLVVSHWPLDFAVHRPDMPLTPFSNARYGLALWDSLPATLAVELPLFAAGVAVYATTTVARDRIGAWAWWSLVAFLPVVYFMNLLGPPPPGIAAVAWVAESGWLLVLWGWWIDRHRAARTLASP